GLPGPIITVEAPAAYLLVNSPLEDFYLPFVCRTAARKVTYFKDPNPCTCADLSIQRQSQVRRRDPGKSYVPGFRRWRVSGWGSSGWLAPPRRTTRPRSRAGRSP